MFGHRTHRSRGGHGHGELERRGGRRSHGRVLGGPLHHRRKDAEAGPGTETTKDALNINPLATAATGVENCPLCDKHCPIDALSCGKGRRMAARSIPDGKNQA